MYKSTYTYYRYVVGLFIVASIFVAPTAFAQSNEELAMQLANPVAAMISLPFQLNYDSNIGAADNGDRYLLNIQPVIPFSLSENWNLISRTILPVVWQDDVFAGEGSQSGLGDAVQSLFFSPKRPTESGWIWAVGPVLLVPTATDYLLGADKWGLGPTFVALKQNGPWTYGGLANHVWSVAGDSDRQDVNATYMQPFLMYTTTGALTFAINTESTYDGKSEQWAVPLNFTVAKVMTIGNQTISLGGGVRYWAESTNAGPEGVGGRLMCTVLFPK